MHALVPAPAIRSARCLAGPATGLQVDTARLLSQPPTANR
jgi:hypothetical protein